MTDDAGLAGIRRARELIQIACGTRPSRALEDALTALREAEEQVKEALARQQRPEELAQQLKRELDRFRQPPLQHALVVGLTPNQEHTVTVSIGGERFDVKVAADLEAASLRPGGGVLLNKDMLTVVGVLGEDPRRGETAEVANVLDPEVPDDPHVKRYQRLQVRHSGGGSMVVECTDSLKEQPLAIGDIVRIDSRLMLAFEKLPPYEAGELQLEEVPDVTYDQIGGLDREIEVIREAIEVPYLHRHLFTRYQLRRPKGILLCGPPGCGKTLIAKAVANSLQSAIEAHLKLMNAAIELLLMARESPEDPSWQEEWRKRKASQAQSPEEIVKEIEAELTYGDIPLDRLESKREEIRASLNAGVRSYFLNVKGPELLNKYVGETEHRIRKVFDEAKRVAGFSTPVVIFFDEMDAMFQTRGSGISSDVEKTIVPQLLAEMDGVESIHDIIVIGASNRPELIDAAILRAGRIDEQITIHRPNRDGASEIFSKYLVPELPLSPEGLERTPEEPEEVAATLTEYAVGLLYDTQNLLRVTTESGAVRTFPLRDFVSGALLEAIVRRAKKQAMMELVPRPAVGPGRITCAHVLASIETELKGSKEQLVHQHPDVPRDRATGRPEPFSVQLRLKGRERRQWFHQKPRAYRGEEVLAEALT